MILRFLNSALPSARFAGALIVSLSLVGGVKRASAADEQANAAPKDDDADEEAPTTPKEPVPMPPPAVTDTTAAKASEPAADAATGLVERLPPSAYPAPVIRGIHGGSLWLSSQGVQWPYLPRTTIGVSGYGWLDTNYRQLHDGLPTAQAKDLKLIGMQGRFVLRVTPTFSKGEYFAQAQAEFVANHDQSQAQPNSADADDVWVRIGKWNSYDLTAGRFEGFEVYHLGMGLDVNTDERKGAFSGTDTPPGLYGATFLYYRPTGPGNLAIHVYPSNNLRFEVLGQAGTLGIYNSAGIRGAGIFDLGWLKIKAAGEYQRAKPPGTRENGDPVSLVKLTNRGFAGSAQFVIDPYLEFGGNFGYALTDLTDNAGNPDTAKSNTETSFGGFANARIIPDLLAGIGVNDARVVDTHFDTTSQSYGKSGHLQMFAALQYFWESQVMIKLVVARAKGDLAPSFSGGTPPFSNTVFSARLRLELLF